MVSGERDDDGVEAGAVTVANPSHSIPLSPIQLPSHIHTSTLSIPLDRANSTHSDGSLSLAITPTHIEHGSSSTLSEDSQRLSPHSSLHHHATTTQPHISSSIACPTHVKDGSEGQKYDGVRRSSSCDNSNAIPAQSQPHVPTRLTRAATIATAATSTSATHSRQQLIRVKSEGDAAIVYIRSRGYSPLSVSCSREPFIRSLETELLDRGDHPLFRLMPFILNPIVPRYSSQHCVPAIQDGSM